MTTYSFFEMRGPGLGRRKVLKAILHRDQGLGGTPLDGGGHQGLNPGRAHGRLGSLGRSALGLALECRRNLQAIALTADLAIGPHPFG